MKELSVEIFRDMQDGREIYEIGEQGTQLANEHAKNLQIVKASRAINLGDLDERLEVGRVNWPRFESDLNIVITSRSLSVNFEKSVGASVRNIGLAVVSTQSLKPSITVAHEFGHLLHMNQSNKDGHC